jgi:PiT family inorganic phosphate transporter
MSWAFTTYLILKGLKKIIKLDFVTASHFGLLVAFIVFLAMRTYLSRTKRKIENNRA